MLEQGHTRDREHPLTTRANRTYKLLQYVVLAAVLTLTLPRLTLAGPTSHVVPGVRHHAARSPPQAWLSARKTLPKEDDVDWDKVPLGELTEIQCWDEYDYPDAPGIHCYRMAAPLDYTNPADKRRASLAVVKYEAGGGATPRAQVLGSVFLNFGGPGLPGVSRIRRKNARTGKYEGERWSAVFENRYDVLSWDTRGVEKTWPRADCYGAAPDIEYALSTFDLGADLAGSSSSALPRQLASYELASASCKNKTGDALRFVATGSTARDLRLLYKAVGDKALNFVGFSYGTAVGSVFADAFPGEVGRFWLDGVLDVPSYITKDRIFGDYVGTIEQVLSGFFRLCASAGPDNCALAALLTDGQRSAGDKGAAALQKKVTDALDALRTVPHAESKGGFPQVLTYGELKTTIFQSLYGPRSWPGLAALLAQGIGNNDWSALLASGGGLSTYAPPPKAAVKKYVSTWALAAISHADFADDSADTKWTLDKIQAQLAFLNKQSHFGGDVIIGNTGYWDVRSVDRWRGNFSSVPANPILFGSNELDPVTPIEGARKMAGLFKGSHLLRVADGIGHCTVAYPSKCASQVVADYFVRGKLPDAKSKRDAAAAAAAAKPGAGGGAGAGSGAGPAPETTCHLDALPFLPQPAQPSANTLDSLSDADRTQAQQVEAHADLATIFADDPIQNLVSLQRARKGF